LKNISTFNYKFTVQFNRPKDNITMKKSILAMMIIASAFMASCGNKTTEEVEVVPTEEVEAPATEEVEATEADSAEVTETEAATN
jgi:hypothetical protein